jgi:hypothetical protein
MEDQHDKFVRSKAVFFCSSRTAEASPTKNESGKERQVCDDKKKGITDRTIEINWMHDVQG